MGETPEASKHQPEKIADSLATCSGLQCNCPVYVSLCLANEYMGGNRGNKAKGKTLSFTGARLVVIEHSSNHSVSLLQ